MSTIEKVGVIGAGLMGAGIAAHIANAGVPVVLLDVVPTDGGKRDAIAEGAVARLLKADPAPLMHKSFAKRITTGNIEDHMERLAECDWIVEAVIEKPEIKRHVYARIDAVRKAGSVVSSNTSTIRLAELVEGMPEAFARDFLITHFFNPPRYMRLLELVAGEATRPQAVAEIRAFADERLGKGVVMAKDTPGFIANRIGAYWLQCAVGEAVDRGLAVEEADAVMGRPLGIPKTGVFGLLDLVGLDLMGHTQATMTAALPPDDPYRAYVRDSSMVDRMVAEGYTGRKGKGGFYRLDRTSGKRVKQAIDLASGEYHDAVKASLESLAAAKAGGPRALLEHADAGGAYAWRVMSRSLAYAASLAEEIADDIDAVDTAMRLGYNWKWGPFELIDKLGAAWFAQRLAADGEAVPDIIGQLGEGTFYRVEAGRLQQFTGAGYADVERPSGVLLLADVKRAGEAVARNGSASLWDVGDGVLCLEFHSQMNALDPASVEMMEKALEIVPERFEALVIHNEGDNFSVGANIGLALFAANIAGWPMIEESIERGQGVYKALKYAPFPVVGAPSGMALGGGCEILLHCDAVQAHAETYIGLVETGVGLIPGWGGCKEMLFRWSGNEKAPGGIMPSVVKVFETVATATVARSAAEARDYLFLRAHDGITMNRDRLLADAKAVALELAEGYAPPQTLDISLPGATARTLMQMAVWGMRKLGRVTPHDEVVAKALAGVLSGGDTDITETVAEDALYAAERRAFMELVRQPATMARLEHMLETGKPLRN